MVSLVYRVAREVGYSPQASQRLCLRLFRVRPAWLDNPTAVAGGSPTGVDTGRRTRARLLAALRAALPSDVDRQLLQRALDSAVIADEVALLPRRQQAVVRWAMEQRCTVREISERTGWTPGQVARLLRAGLTTLTVRGWTDNSPR